MITGVWKVITLPINRQNWDLDILLYDLNQHVAFHQGLTAKKALRDWKNTGHKKSWE
jgi:hypothetical protein